MNQSIKTNSLISILFMCIGMLSVKAQNSITIHPTTESVKIDGEINEADWKQHLQNQNFTQLRPDNGQPSIRKTEVAVLNDESYLYVLAIMHVESKDEINNQLTERDGLGTSDFFGLNHYTTMLAAENHGIVKDQNVYGNGGISEDQNVDLSLDPTWKTTLMNWAVVPWGCTKLLHWIAERYDNPDIIITENGCAYPDELEDGEVNDQERLEFYKTYLQACYQAITEGVKLKGYFAWSFMDNFEWSSGYEQRFGLHYVDFKTLERIPKKSAHWLKKAIKHDSADVTL